MTRLVSVAFVGPLAGRDEQNQRLNRNLCHAVVVRRHELIRWCHILPNVTENGTDATMIRLLTDLRIAPSAAG